MEQIKFQNENPNLTVLIQMIKDKLPHSDIEQYRTEHNISNEDLQLALAKAQLGQDMRS